MKNKIILFAIIAFLLVVTSIFPRYYNPDIGRFVSADVVTPGGGSDLQGLNRYAYCLNNPVIYVDPSGNTPEGTRQIAETVKYTWPIFPTLWNLTRTGTPVMAKTAFRLGLSTATLGLSLLIPSNAFEVPYDEIKDMESKSSRIFNSQFIKTPNFDDYSDDDLRREFSNTGDNSYLNELNNRRQYVVKNNARSNEQTETVKNAFKTIRRQYELVFFNGKIFTQKGTGLIPDTLYNFIITPELRVFAALEKDFSHLNLSAYENIIAPGRLKLLENDTLLLENWSGTFKPGHLEINEAETYFRDRGIDKIQLKFNEFK